MVVRAGLGATGSGTAQHFGQIYSWGFCTHGQLGLKEQILGAREYVDTPTHVGLDSALSEVELKGAACGHFHSLTVDSAGNVYAFGRDDQGQLGGGAALEDSEESLRGAVPRLVRSLSHLIIADVGCGAFHSLARTADGCLYSWGCNRFGQLGRPTTYQCDITPEAVRAAKGVEESFVRNYAAGFAHSAAVLRTGQVITWGSNKDGQLGVGSAIRHPDVATTPIFVNDVVGRQVAAGDSHLLVLTFDGEVYAAGDASYGQLGIGHESKKACAQRGGRFAKVLDLPWSEDGGEERIALVSAGGATSAARSTRGALYTWGGGVWGQLGNGDQSDVFRPLRVSGLPRVRHVAVAQDHMLAICCRPPSDADASTEDVDDDIVASWPSSLWIWGRKKLLPTVIGADVDPESQCKPAEVPLAQLGVAGTIGTKGGALTLTAVCGGSHSLALITPARREDPKKWHVAAWCPQMCTVSGLGASGGPVSEPLAFKIVSRNEDGRDEKVGGLRFHVRLGHKVDSTSRGSTRSSWKKSASTGSLRNGGVGAAEELKNLQDVFDLQYLKDCCDGTYEGVYMVRQPGDYVLHVELLLPEADQDVQESKPRGTPVSGSPFSISIASGPAFAMQCGVRLRNAAARGPKLSVLDPSQTQDVRKSDSTGNANFKVEASSQVTWEVLACDVLGFPCTSKEERFVASIKRLDDETSAEEGTEQVVSNLAEAMGVTSHAHDGQSNTMKQLRDNIAQRKAERLWMRMSGSQPKLQPKDTDLTVRPCKSIGLYETKWTPDAVGRYQLAVKLVRADCPSGQHLRGSPWDVSVVAGKISAGNSKLIVLGAGEGTKPLESTNAALGASPTSLTFDFVGSEESPSAEIAIRLLLQDRTGNACQERLDPLRYVLVRADSATLSTGGSGVAEDVAAGALEWTVAGSRGGAVSLTLRARQALVDRAVELCSGDGSVAIIQFFVSATDRVSHQRLMGSPCRVRVRLKTPVREIPVPKEEVVARLELASSADVVAAQPSPPLPPSDALVACEKALVHSTVSTSARTEAPVPLGDVTAPPPPPLAGRAPVEQAARQVQTSPAEQVEPYFCEDSEKHQEVSVNALDADKRDKTQQCQNGDTRREVEESHGGDDAGELPLQPSKHVAETDGMLVQAEEDVLAASAGSSSTIGKLAAGDTACKAEETVAQTSAQPSAPLLPPLALSSMARSPKSTPDPVSGSGRCISPEQSKMLASTDEAVERSSAEASESTVTPPSVGALSECSFQDGTPQRSFQLLPSLATSFFSGLEEASRVLSVENHDAMKACSNSDPAVDASEAPVVDSAALAQHGAASPAEPPAGATSAQAPPAPAARASPREQRRRTADAASSAAERAPSKSATPVTPSRALAGSGAALLSQKAEPQALAAAASDARRRQGVGGRGARLGFTGVATPGLGGVGGTIRGARGGAAASATTSSAAAHRSASSSANAAASAAEAQVLRRPSAMRTTGASIVFREADTLVAPSPWPQRAANVSSSAVSRAATGSRGS